MRWQFDGPEPLVGLFGPGERWGAPQVAANNGGELRRVTPGADGAGAAVGFPEVCAGDKCPRVAVKGPDYPELDPGTRPFTVGASVLIRRDQLTTDHGSNLVQKGLASSAQWKLQIDSGDEGRPSCVVRSTDGANPVVVISPDSVADGAWHRIVCQRTEDALEIVIDDAVTGSVPLQADYLISPAGHLVTVGAKGAGPNNDQFHGLLDEIFFSLG
jgi:hypothetical protein